MPSADTVLQQLKKGDVSPFYFLCGEEAFDIDRVSDFIEQNLLKSEEKSFDQAVFYGKDIRLDDVLEAVRRFPVVAKRQVVIIKEAQEIADLSTEKGKQRLSKYSEKPVPSTVLVMAYKHKKIDANTKFAKELDRNAVFINTKKLYDNQVPAWINDYLQKRQCTATPQAVALLADSIGNDLSRIANEIDKMLLNFTPPLKIDEAAVTKYVGINREYNVFELQKAIAQRNTTLSFKIIDFFGGNPKTYPVIPTIALLFNYFTKVLSINQLMATGKGEMPQKEWARVLGVNPYFVDDYLKAARNYPLIKTIRIIRHIRDADLESKGLSGAVSDYHVLQNLVIKIFNT
ncbi:MAG: DNA polymerase III subunit delta [Cytophagales bacterium]|nr:MAG: DNA polymerase III subunit delta [Cytophagales bacterium]TAF59645.1 MAG: DNA polymerase III subunit delta [Cytophagales bacterium]